jgi:uncharacterized protein YkwD
MKTNLCSLAAVALCGVLLASCASPPAINKVPMSASSSSDKSLTSQLLNEVNSYRASKGAGPLVRNPGLDRMAQEHCAFLMRNRGKFKIYGSNVSHFGFESRNLVARQMLGIPTLGENVAAIPSGSTPALVRAWADTPGHDFTMKSNDWQQTGIGILVDQDGMVFATQLFVTPTSSQMTFNNRLTSF